MIVGVDRLILMAIMTGWIEHLRQDIHDALTLMGVVSSVIVIIVA